MQEKYKNLLNILKPYIICSRDNLDYFSLENDIGCISEDLIFDPLKVESKNFIDDVFTMDKISFGSQGMAMERWVFLDCSVMPGAVIGFAIHSSNLSNSDRKIFNIVDKERWIPMSMYIAIPTAHSQYWFGHNLSSLNGKIEKKLDGLGFLTKYFALKVLPMQYLKGATQWGSLAIHVHLKFGPMLLESALTYSHSFVKTLCYKTNLTNKNDLKIVNLKNYKKIETINTNIKTLEKIQSDIEAGAKVYLLKVVDHEHYQIGYL